MTTLSLTPEESRILGVLIEKGYCTPQQYPLSLNALVAGCNQKSSRNPVVQWEEHTVEMAVNRLRGKGLAIVADASGGRVLRYRHDARDALKLEVHELCILAELLLRGPQTLGELRTNAGRMKPFESLDNVRRVVEQLCNQDPPLVRMLPRSPGSRADLYAQLLCPDLHSTNADHYASAITTAAAGTADSPATMAAATPAIELAPAPAVAELQARVEALEQNLEQLQAQLNRLEQQLGPLIS